MLSIRTMTAQGLYPEALSCTESWIEKLPTNRDFRFMRIRIHAWNKDFARSQQFLRDEKEIDAESHMLRGEISFMQKQWSRAASHYLRALKTTPKGSALYRESRRRWIQSRLGLRLSAEPWLTEAQADEPENPEWRQVPKVAGDVPPKPLSIHAVLQLWQAQESQQWQAQEAALHLGLRSLRGIDWGILAKTKERSLPGVSYSDAAYGFSALWHQSSVWSWELASTFSSRSLIYPARQFTVTGRRQMTKPFALSLGAESRAYSAGPLLTLVHVGGFHESDTLLMALQGHLGVGSQTAGSTSFTVRSLNFPVNAAVHAAAGREESSRPYLQSGELIQDFHSFGISILWNSPADTWRLRMGCERREEHAFWYNACDISLGVFW